MPCGVWTLFLVGLVLTSVMQTAIGVFGLLLLAIGVALLTRPPSEAAGDTARATDPTSSIALQ